MKEIKKVIDFYDKTYLKSYNLDKSIQYQLNLCKLWNDIGTCIGPTHDIYPDKFPPICIKGL